MQTDTSLPPLPVPSAPNSVLGAHQQASVSEVPSKSETECHACLTAPRKPSILKVILGVMADKGPHSRVSLTVLRNALTTAGYNMTRNAWCFKRVLKRLVDKGVLKQVTGRGTLGSFRMGKKHASKLKLKTKRRKQKQQHQSGQRRSGQRQSGQRRSGQCRSGQRRSGQRRSGQRLSRQRRLPLSSKQGHKWLTRRSRRVAKCHRN